MTKPAQRYQRCRASDHNARTRIMAKTELTAERLRELLHYDPATGLFTWLANIGSRGRAGAVAGWNCLGYRCITIDTIKHRAHRLAWLYTYGILPSAEIDHINGIRCDNRISNLREASPSTNRQNSLTARAHSKTGVIGVSLDQRDGRYYARIYANGKRRALGGFESIEEARHAYLDAKRLLHPGWICSDAHSS